MLRAATTLLFPFAARLMNVLAEIRWDFKRGETGAGRIFSGKSAAGNMPDDVTVQRNLQVNPVCHHCCSVSSFTDLGRFTYGFSLLLLSKCL